MGNDRKAENYLVKLLGEQEEMSKREMNDMIAYNYCVEFKNKLYVYSNYFSIAYLFLYLENKN